MVGGNSVNHFSNPNAPYTRDYTKDEILVIIRNKYPEMENLLICMVQKESSFNQYAIGDSGLAKGIAQIHTDKHNITEWCAFDVECSLDWTVKKIKQGYGYWWTAYPYCP